MKNYSLVFLWLAGAFLSACEVDKPGAETPADVSSVPSALSLAELEERVADNPLKDAYFGETHVHTSFSLDAYIGGARLTPHDAYRFAKGEDVTLNGRSHNIVRALDFTAVTDHAEFIGEMYSTQVEGAPGYDNELLVELRGLQTFEEQEAWFMKYVVENMRSGDAGHPPFYAGPHTSRSAWKVIQDAAREHYEPGRFTTILAFEWSATQQGGNMHRNVFFRDTTVPDIPLNAIDTNDEEKLWDWMALQESQGSTLFAIPHNSNASKGYMFDSVDNKGDAYAAAYARNRNKWEPLVEIMQIKANSEVHPKFWSADEFADFENGDSIQNSSGRIFQKQNFVRWAIIRGLYYSETLGVNPYQLGIIGGTDSHNGTPSDVVEENYVGSHGGADNSVERRRTGSITGWIDGRDSNPGAIAGVWANKNTRSAIWDAMKARETFATSGTRIKPRFFCGFGLDGSASDPLAMVRNGYESGVPMGGTLNVGDGALTCTVHSSKDPEGANLDRIQIIKGWVDKDGAPQERIIDVVWSGARVSTVEGKLPSVGNTVNLENATYTNSIGSSQLLGSWTDDAFDAERHALYYMRVLEIPTPRWTTYDAVEAGLPLLEGVPATIQERAWTSPIWYTP